MTDNTTTADKQPTRGRKRPLGILGMGATACAACCAGPILAFLAAAGVFTAAGVALFGVFGLVPVVAWYVRPRRATAVGNTGRARVSATQPMPSRAALAELLREADG